MMDHVRSFTALTPDEQPLAGGKGGMLARLYQSGYPVPDGFVVLPSGFAGDELTAEAWAQVQEHLTRLRGENPGIAFAVRSSALSEDSASTSFAGEFETVLDVRTDDDIEGAIRIVRRSRKGERVEVYSQAKGLGLTHDIAVVVQQMVPAEIAGVLFTADPVTGSFACMAGRFVHGLGDRLVSGEATGVPFALQRPTGRYEGPADLRRFPRRLHRLASRLERELGCPQDVEWAIARGELFLLQSRPITTLQGHNHATGEWNDSLTGDFLWSNVNLGEAMPDVMTPFAWSVMQRGALVDWIEVGGFRSIGNIGGRPYFNISVFASLFHAFGKSDRGVLEVIEGALHLSLPEGMEIPLLPVSRRALLSLVPRLVAVQWRQMRDVRNLPALLAANPAWCREKRQRIEEAGSGAELAALWQDEIRPYRTRVWSAYLSGTNYHVGYTTQLRRRLTELVGPDDADVLISGLSSESELLTSLGPVVGLAKLVGGEITRKAYVALYGHRGPHEFEFSIPRPAEDPGWLDRQMAEFERAPVDVEARLAKQRADFEAAWQRLRERYPRQAKGLRHRIDQVGPRARLREAVRSEFGHVAWVFRAWALRAGELTGLGDDIFFLTVEEILDSLSGDGQMTQFISARRQTYERYATLPPYPAVIRGRFDPFEWAADPDRRSDIFDSHTAIPGAIFGTEDDDRDVLVGAAGSAGRVEGVVRRLDSPEAGKQLQPGEILVTAQTNIGWTVLFPRAAAIITDVGAPLSHTAIVARELGIPAVVGCGGATMCLKTGDRVLVDGGRGVVRILETALHVATSGTASIVEKQES